MTTKGRYTGLGAIIVLALAFCSHEADATSGTYTQTFISSPSGGGSSITFNDSNTGGTHTLTIGTNSACTGTYVNSNFTQSSCTFVDGSGTINGTAVTAKWGSCAGSAVKDGSTFTLTQKLSLEVVANDNSYDCTSNCTQTSPIDPSTRGTFASPSGSDPDGSHVTTSFLSNTQGPTFATGTNCSGSQVTALEQALSAIHSSTYVLDVPRCW